MHTFDAQPSPSYQSLVPHQDGQVLERGGLQFNTYATVEPLASPQFYEDHRQNARLKKIIRILRFVSRLAATVVSVVTTTQEIVTLRTYLSTRNVQRGGRGPWAKQTSLWPTIMLLSASGITTILGVVILIAYLTSIKKANKVSTAETWVSVTVEVAHIILWIVVAILYRLGKNGKDLWGWACSPVAQGIQSNFSNVLHFDAVCSRGASSWHLAIASAGIQLLGGIIWFLVHRRSKVQKRMKTYG